LFLSDIGVYLRLMKFRGLGFVGVHRRLKSRELRIVNRLLVLIRVYLRLDDLGFLGRRSSAFICGSKRQ